MSFIWVQKPDDGLKVSEVFSKKIDDKMVSIHSIEKRTEVGVCHLCGKSQLSKEHVPSKKAFNKHNLISFKIRRPLGRFLSWESEINQGGNVVRTLCSDCNNLTGAWYNPAYVKFARYCSKVAVLGNANKILPIRFDSHPLRIAKQALIHIISTSQSGLVKEYPMLKSLILNKETKESIEPFRLGMYLRCHKGARTSGITIIGNKNVDSVEVLSEFSFYPFGWILAFQKETMNDLCDVSNWFLEGYFEKKTLELEVPCYWTIQAYPKDFRSPVES